jgi:Lrp/AsnC family transcriptional regulator for asnA, asnC and gidA
MDSKKRDNIIDSLFNIDGVREISEVTGRFDIMVTMYAKNLNEMYKVVSEKIGKIDGIIGSESFIEMKRRTKSMPYLSGE